jgi:hypothetical protein
MKRFNHILLILFLGVFFFASCDDETKEVELIQDGKNLVVFEATNQAVTEVADGTEYKVQVKVKLQGPSTDKVGGDITVNVGYDQTLTTAVEGTHFRLDNPSIVLKQSNNYLGLYEFTMLTEGIVTPLAKSPLLYLTFSSATGAENVIASAKAIKVTLNFACPSELQGSYSVVMVRDGTTTYTFQDNITKTGVGTYRTSEVGHWIGGLGVGTNGYTFTDVCGVINVPEQNLVDYYSNKVYGNGPGTVDEETGVITISYTITFAAGDRVYECVYTPN